MRKRISALAVAAGTTAVLAFGGWAPAHAGESQSAVVRANPADDTPWIDNGRVTAITEVGDTVIAGGSFTKVQAAGNSSHTVHRPYLVAFDRDTGKIDADFTPKLDGKVKALAAGPNGTVYVGGTFKHVNGESQRGVVRLQVSDGKQVGSFHGSLDNGTVETLAYSHKKLFVGGYFTKVDGHRRVGLARLNGHSGAVEAGLNLPIGKARVGSLRVQNLAVSPNGDTLVIDGTFTEVAGHHRQQIAKIDDASGSAKLADWATDGFAGCNKHVQIYADGIDFAPDGSYFVVAATGGYRRGHVDDTYCDGASRWETSAKGSHATPTWMNRTGGDSLYTVAVTGSAVYVGGHQRWLDNADGQDSAGKHAASRPGIAAINPKSGKALSWNPTKTRGHGVTALYADEYGLWEGCDTATLAHENHPRIGFFPLPKSAQPKPTHQRATATPTPSDPPASADPSSAAPTHPAGQAPNDPSPSPSQASATPSPSASATHAAASDGDSGGLPFTGAPVVWFGALAGVLILGGGTLVLVNRKLRRQ